jgi:succinyl-diaminopimelate desuccinylase
MKKLDDTALQDTADHYDEDYGVQTSLWSDKHAGVEAAGVPLTEIVDLAAKFVEVPSVSGNSEKAVEVLQIAKEQLIDHKFSPFVSDGLPSLLYGNQNTDKFKIILNAHLDVVPGELHQYNPHVKDGKLYGRGAYDMKGAAAVMIKLYDEIADQLDYPLGLQLVTDEELAGGRCTYTQLEKGVRTELAIIGECGSNFDIINETKGLVHATLIASGAKAHGAYVWRGQNAILKMYEALNIIHQHFPTPHEETSETTINVSKIHTSNETWNLVPDDCTATLDIRYNRKDKETILERVRSLLPEGVILKVEKTRNSHYTDSNHAYINTLREVGREVTGEPFKVRNTFGGSDTSFFSEFGCEAVEFGPIGGGQHDGGEWVSIQGLADYYQILKKFLLSVK